MTAKDRDKLAALARKRARVAKSDVKHRAQVLRAEVEDQLSAIYSAEDELFAAINQRAREKDAKTDAEIAAICKRIGIPKHLRPHRQSYWSGRGENADSRRRAELHRLAFARIDAGVEHANHVIDRHCLDVETKLVTDGLESAEARRFLEAMPTVEQMLPNVNVAELPGAYVPPIGAAGALLTPTTASGREAKRQAFAELLAANPDASNRKLAKVVDIDHHTAGKWRAEAGEIPTKSGEIPSGDGEPS